MPEMKQIQNAIDYFQPNGFLCKDKDCSCRCHETAAIILQHVKEHGLALDEGEIEKIIYREISGLNFEADRRLCKQIAKAITERQKI
jgi:hypothetical protein